MKIRYEKAVLVSGCGVVVVWCIILFIMCEWSENLKLVVVVVVIF
jgi:hypothetical protein